MFDRDKHYCSTNTSTRAAREIEQSSPVQSSPVHRSSPPVQSSNCIRPHQIQSGHTDTVSYSMARWRKHHCRYNGVSRTGGTTNSTQSSQHNYKATPGTQQKHKSHQDSLWTQPHHTRRYTGNTGIPKEMSLSPDSPRGSSTNSAAIQHIQDMHHIAVHQVKSFQPEELKQSIATPYPEFKLQHLYQSLTDQQIKEKYKANRQPFSRVKIDTIAFKDEWMYCIS